MKLLLIIAAFFVFILAILFLQLRSDGTQCLADPGKYFLKVGYKATGHNMTCTCSFNSERYIPFIIDDTGLTPIYTEPKRDYEDINWSLLFK